MICDINLTAISTAYCGSKIHIKTQHFQWKRLKKWPWQRKSIDYWVRNPHYLPYKQNKQNALQLEPEQPINVSSHLVKCSSYTTNLAIMSLIMSHLCVIPILPDIFTLHQNPQPVRTCLSQSIYFYWYQFLFSTTRQWWSKYIVTSEIHAPLKHCTLRQI